MAERVFPVHKRHLDYVATLLATGFALEEVRPYIEVRFGICKHHALQIVRAYEKHLKRVMAEHAEYETEDTDDQL